MREIVGLRLYFYESKSDLAKSKDKAYALRALRRKQHWMMHQDFKMLEVVKEVHRCIQDTLNVSKMAGKSHYMKEVE